MAQQPRTTLGERPKRTLQFDFDNKNKRGKNLTKSEIDNILSEYKKGVEVRDISSKLNYPYNTVYNYLHRNGIISRKYETVRLNKSGKRKMGRKPYNNRKDVKMIKDFLSQAWYKRIFSKLK